MEVSNNIKIDENNKVHFTGILHPMELRVILSIGINYLLSIGAISTGALTYGGVGTEEDQANEDESIH